jgi:hypothetical protein
MKEGKFSRYLLFGVFRFVFYFGSFVFLFLFLFIL